MTVKYSKRIPAIYLRCKKTFGVSWDKGIIMTYGDTVYCKFDLEDHVKIHEEVHVRQQLDMGPAKWWDKYLQEKDFRLAQELEAYRAQLDYIEKVYSRKQYIFSKKEIAYFMSTLYGNMCTYEEAIKLLDEKPATTTETDEEEGGEN